MIVSLYYQFRYRRSTYSGTLQEFVSDPDHVANVLKFYDVWWNLVRSTDSTLVLRYEDLHSEPERSLREALDFIGVSGVSDEVVSEAVEFARFDNMRQYEQDGVFQSARLRPGSSDEAASFKTRRGEIGSHRDELPERIVRELDRAVADSRATAFGYH